MWNRRAVGPQWYEMLRDFALRSSRRRSSVGRSPLAAPLSFPIPVISKQRLPISTAAQPRRRRTTPMAHQTPPASPGLLLPSSHRTPHRHSRQPRQQYVKSILSSPPHPPLPTLRSPPSYPPLAPPPRDATDPSERPTSPTPPPRVRPPPSPSTHPHHTARRDAQPP